MKKLILSIVAVAGIALGSNAQTKGQTIIGGTASYQSSKSDAVNANAAQNLSLVPSVGYFVADNFAIGTGVGYNSSNTGVASTTGHNEAFIVSPFGRYYVPLNNQFKFFGQASVPMAFGTVKSTDANGDVITKTGTSTAVGVALAPGFAFYPTSKIAVEFSFRGAAYNSYKVKDANDNDIIGAGREDFSIGTNFFTPQIGIQFQF